MVWPLIVPDCGLEIVGPNV